MSKFSRMSDTEMDKAVQDMTTAGVSLMGASLGMLTGSIVGTLAGGLGSAVYSYTNDLGTEESQRLLDIVSQAGACAGGLIGGVAGGVYTHGKVKQAFAQERKNKEAGMQHVSPRGTSVPRV